MAGADVAKLVSSGASITIHELRVEKSPTVDGIVNYKIVGNIDVDANLTLTQALLTMNTFKTE